MNNNKPRIAVAAIVFSLITISAAYAQVMNTTPLPMTGGSAGGSIGGSGGAGGGAGGSLTVSNNQNCEWTNLTLYTDSRENLGTCKIRVTIGGFPVDLQTSYQAGVGGQMISFTDCTNVCNKLSSCLK